MNKDKRQYKVAVGISGGVDSAVTAALLIEQGYTVTGIHMQNWESDDKYCTSNEDLESSKQVCKHLGIDIEIIEFKNQYLENVFNICLDEFAKGLTPNPDILCNSEIKFKALTNYLFSNGFDYVATGHYAQIKERNGQYQLLRAVDDNKDQTYFLSALHASNLKNILFPLGKLKKTEVRRLAEQLKLPNAKRKDSTGICFIGKRPFKAFLREYLLDKPGEIVNEQGKSLGKHQGLMFYTIGQRKGLDIGGVKDLDEKCFYVISKEIESNKLIVSQDSSLLYKNQLTAKNANWINDAPENDFRCFAMIRHRQTPHACHVKIDGATLIVHFDEPIRAITAGQYIAFYDNKLCLGNAIIC